MMYPDLADECPRANFGVNLGVGGWHGRIPQRWGEHSKSLKRSASGGRLFDI
jgi:hypothetical protein